MIRRILAMLVVGVLVTGCGSSMDWVNRTADVTPEQRERDKAACIFGATETVPGAQGPRQQVNRDRDQRCMEDRGYTLEKVTE